jgi:hypothetical protein
MAGQIGRKELNDLAEIATTTASDTGHQHEGALNNLPNGFAVGLHSAIPTGNLCGKERVQVIQLLRFEENNGPGTTLAHSLQRKILLVGGRKHGSSLSNM